MSEVIPISAQNIGVNIISFDGGSIPDGASRIFVLRELMRRIQDVKDLDEEPTPSQYFSLFGGSGVGAILLLLFGLRLSCEVAMTEYTVIAQAFSMEDSFFNSLKLKDAIQNLTERYLGKKDARLLEVQSKIFICCSNTIGNRVRVFRSYRVKQQVDDGVTIWQAILAAMAHPSMFSPISIEMNGIEETFISASDLFQNPTMEALKEGERVFGKEAQASSILSLGSQHIQRRADVFSGVIDRISAASDYVHQEAVQRFEDLDIYFRFNVESTDLDISTWIAPFRSELLSKTLNYLEALSYRIEACAKCVSSRKGSIEFLELNRAAVAEALPKPRPPLSRQYVRRNEIHDFVFSRIFPSQLTPKQLRCILHGVGGSGKTQAILHFISRYEDRFWRVFYIDANNEEQIQSDLQTAIRSLGRRYKDKTWKDALQLLASERRPWLLVFDNADDPTLPLQHYFPDCNHGAVLVTTRNREGAAWARGAEYQIKEMRDEEAVGLLHASADIPPPSPEMSLRIVRELGCLALAIAQAGGYIFQTRNYESYLAAFQMRRNSLTSDGPIQGDTRYNLNVYAAWELSFGLLDERAQSFVHICSKLHHSLIPRSMFERGRSFDFQGTIFSSELPPPDNLEELANALVINAGDDLSLDKITQQLSRCSLMDITFDRQNQFFTFHSLVHKWAANRKKNPSRSLPLAVRLLSSSITNDDSEDGYTQRRELLPHIMALPVEYLTMNARDSYGFGRVLLDAGQWSTCLKLEEYILSESKRLLGAESVEMRVTMAHVALQYYHLGRFREAEVLWKELFQFYAQNMGERDPDTITAIGHLALMYSRLGRYKEAEELQQHVLDMRIHAFGQKHSSTIDAKASLAHTYSRLGRYQEAKDMQKEVLDMRLEMFGQNHSSTIAAMAQLAGTYSQLGRYQEAENMQKQVLDMRLEMFGKKHPDTILAMANLAVISHDLGRHEEAIVTQEQVVRLRQEKDGLNHPDTLHVMSNLAIGLQTFNRWDESVLQLEEVVRLREKVIGPRHSDTIWSTYWLAVAYSHSDELKALELGEVVLSIAEEVLGPYHPRTVMYRGGVEKWRSGDEGAISQSSKVNTQRSYRNHTLSHRGENQIP